MTAIIREAREDEARERELDQLRALITERGRQRPVPVPVPVCRLAGRDDTTRKAS